MGTRFIGVRSSQSHTWKMCCPLGERRWPQSAILHWEHLALPFLQTWLHLNVGQEPPYVAFISPCTSLGTPASLLAISSYTEEAKRRLAPGHVAGSQRGRQGPRARC